MAAMNHMSMVRMTTKGMLSVDTAKSQATGAKPTRSSPTMARHEHPSMKAWVKDNGDPATQEKTYRLGKHRNSEQTPTSGILSASMPATDKPPNMPNASPNTA